MSNAKLKVQWQNAQPDAGQKVDLRRSKLTRLIRRTTIYVLMTCLILILLLALFITGKHLYLNHKVNKLYASIRSKNQPTSYAELNDLYKYPDGPNAADYYLPIFRVIDDTEQTIYHAEYNDYAQYVRRIKLKDVLAKRDYSPGPITISIADINEQWLLEGNTISLIDDGHIESDDEQFELGDPNYDMLDMESDELKTEEFTLEEIQQPAFDLPFIGLAPELWANDKVPTELLNDVETYLSLFEEPINKLLNAPHFAGNRWPFDYSNPESIDYGHHSNLRKTLDLLKLHFWLAVHQNRADDSLQTLKAIRQLFLLVNDDYDSIAHYYQNAILYTLRWAADYSLNRHLYNDDQLKKLDQICNRHITPERIQLSYVQERMDAMIIADRLDSESLQEVFDWYNLPTPTELELKYWKYTAIKQSDLLYCINIYNQIIDMYANGQYDDQVIQQLIIAAPENYYLTKLRWGLSPHLTQITDTRYAILNMRIDMARILIALQRYYLAHQSYPDQLEDLIPQYIDTIPIDYYDKNKSPIRYIKGEDGCVIYSVNKNQIDEDGLSTDAMQSYTSNQGDLCVYLSPKDKPYKAIFTELIPDAAEAYHQKLELDGRNYIHKRHGEELESADHIDLDALDPNSYEVIDEDSPESN